MDQRDPGLARLAALQAASHEVMLLHLPSSPNLPFACSSPLTAPWPLPAPSPHLRVFCSSRLSCSFSLRVRPSSPCRHQHSTEPQAYARVRHSSLLLDLVVLWCVKCHTWYLRHVRSTATQRRDQSGPQARADIPTPPNWHLMQLRPSMRASHLGAGQLCVRGLQLGEGALQLPTC